MFADCSGLTSLDVSKWNTANVTNMKELFYDCSSLTVLDVSKWNTSKTTNMCALFWHCDSLVNADVSDWNTSNVTDFSLIFSNCGKLTTLDVSHFDTSNAIDMSQMFYSCGGLTNLDVSSFNTSKVTSMSSMFFGCNGLSNIDVSNFDTANVTNMAQMFYSCSGLTILDLSNFDTSNVTTMYRMFFDDSSLTTIYASNKWSIDALTSSESMFYNCIKLKGDIAYTSGYTDKTYAKIHEGYLTYKGLPATLAEGSSWYKSKQNRNTITKITLMDSYTPTTTVDETWNADVNNTGDITCYRTGAEIIIAGNGSGKILANANSRYLFSDSSMKSKFKKLTSIENLALLDTANVTNMNHMFYFCSGLTSLDLSHFDTANVTNMNYMFHSCSELKNIYAGDHWNTDKVTSSGRMFGGCTVLEGAISYDSSKEDATYANWTTGYFTYKAASTKTLSLNIDPTSGAVTSYDVSMAPIARFRAFLDWSDTANVA